MNQSKIVEILKRMLLISDFVNLISLQIFLFERSKCRRMLSCSSVM